MPSIFFVQLVSGYNDFSALGIYACIMIMKFTLLLIVILDFRWLF